MKVAISWPILCSQFGGSQTWITISLAQEKNPKTNDEKKQMFTTVPISGFCLIRIIAEKAMIHWMMRVMDNVHKIRNSAMIESVSISTLPPQCCTYPSSKISKTIFVIDANQQNREMDATTQPPLRINAWFCTAAQTTYSKASEEGAEEIKNGD